MFRCLAVFATEAVAVDEAADAAHGPGRIGEGRVWLQSRRFELHRREGKNKLMTPERNCQWLHLQGEKGIKHVKQRKY